MKHASGVADPQDWLYPTNPDSEYRLFTELGAKNRAIEVSRENLWPHIEKHLAGVDDWHLSSGYRQMIAGDRIWIVDVKRPKAIVAMGQALEVYATETGWRVDLLWDRDVTETLRRSPVSDSMYEQQIRSVRRATTNELAVLRRWLSANRVALPGPIALPEPPPIDERDARKKVLREISVRRGQVAFRTDLIEAYGGRCAISESSTVAVLEAAHILPYRGEHTNVVTNGILLRSDIHTLFDLHLLSVNHDGFVRVSSQLRGTEYAEFDGIKLRVPRERRYAPSKDSLKRHAREFIA